MKLNELHGYKQYQDKTLLNIFDDFDEKHGHKFAEGGFGVVFLPKGQNFVYKLWIDDDGYDGFYEVALKHQDNPFFPKYLSKKKILPAFTKRRTQAANVKYCIVKMEKLIKSNYYEAVLVSRILGIFAEQPNITLQEFLELDDISELNDKHWSTNLYEAGMALQRMQESHSNIRFDVHTGNFMNRGSQIVINDPFAPKQFKIDINTLNPLGSPDVVTGRSK